MTGWEYEELKAELAELRAGLVELIGLVEALLHVRKE